MTKDNQQAHAQQTHATSSNSQQSARDVVAPRNASDPASDQLELLRGLKDVARAESIRNPMGHAAGAWRRVAKVLDRIAPDPKPEPEPLPEPKGRDR